MCDFFACRVVTLDTGTERVNKAFNMSVFCRPEDGETVCFFKTLVCIYEYTRCYNPEQVHVAL
jgi:hypothetical protein